VLNESGTGIVGVGVSLLILSVSPPVIHDFGSKLKAEYFALSSKVRIMEEKAAEGTHKR
jgi:hypothetical protein